MPAIHRQDDNRACGATTVVTGQSTVYANNKLVSVNDDPNTHGGGSLNAGTNKVYINNKLVVDDNDSASADALCPPLGGAHCAPSATSGSPNVFIGDA